MDEEKRKKIHEIEIVVAVVLVLVSVAMLFPRPGITGYVSYETKTQELNLTIANSQSYVLTTDSEEPFSVTSLRLSGEVIGDGIAKAYIGDKDQKINIYSNVIKKGSGLGDITGMDEITGEAIAVDTETEESNLVIAYLENIEPTFEEISEDETLSAGSFDYVCIESCFIDMLLNKDLSYTLIFYIEEGTILNINKIVYTIRKD